MDVAGTNVNQALITEGHKPYCPSCDNVLETYTHVLHCEEAGRVDALHCLIDWLDNWLKEAGTEPSIQEGIVEYAHRPGEVKMEDITRGWGPGFHKMGRSQDKIGWMQFMKGMILKKIIPIQADYIKIGACTVTLNIWSQGACHKHRCKYPWPMALLQQSRAGRHRKSKSIGSKGGDSTVCRRSIRTRRGGTKKKDHYLLKVNLEDLGSTTGEEQHY